MEFSRSWRELSLTDLLRSTSGLIRGWRITHFLVWCVGILMVGMLTGAMAVLFPPIASIGFVALVGVVLLWAMPDLHAVPDNMLRKMFFVMVFVQLCIPAYYALDTGVLPWISVRRLFAVTVILLFGIAIAGSKEARTRIIETLRNEKILATLCFGFFLMLFVSFFSSENPLRSFRSIFDSFLTWYVPLLACILIVRTKQDVTILMAIIATCGIVDSLLGAVEFLLERRFYFDIFPKSILESMLATNPNLEIIYTTSQFRNGIYRASSIYTVPLSFGEFAAMVAPIGCYFLFHGDRLLTRAFGGAAVLSTLVALLVSGARGGSVAFLVAVPLLFLLWAVRYSRINRASLVGALMAAVFLAGTVATIGAVFYSGRLSKIVFGGGDTTASTQARFIQWEMAYPHILSNPVTGHGGGSSAELVGFFNPGNPIPTIDSYVITLLVDHGVPGLVLFFGMIAIGIWIGIRLYLTNLQPWAAVGGPIACCLVAFAVYRLALSQSENHTLMFLVIGLVFTISKLNRDQSAHASALSSQPLDARKKISESPLYWHPPAHS